MTDTEEGLSEADVSRICLEAWLRELWAGRDPRETLRALMC